MREWKNQDLVGLEPRASHLPDENYTIEPHRITVFPGQIYTSQDYLLSHGVSSDHLYTEIFEDGLYKASP